MTTYQQTTDHEARCRIGNMVSVFELLGDRELASAYSSLLSRGRIFEISPYFETLRDAEIIDGNGYPTFRACVEIAVTRAHWCRLGLEDWLKTDIRDTQVADALADDYNVTPDHTGLDRLWEDGKTYGQALSCGDLDVENLRATDFFDHNPDGTMKVLMAQPSECASKHHEFCFCMNCMFPTERNSE